jgi:hypothetical protein
MHVDLARIHTPVAQLELQGIPKDNRPRRGRKSEIDRWRSISTAESNRSRVDARQAPVGGG